MCVRVCPETLGSNAVTGIVVGQLEFNTPFLATGESILCKLHYGRHAVIPHHALNRYLCWISDKDIMLCPCRMHAQFR